MGVIYLLINKLNDKKYVGLDRYENKRIKDHLRRSKESHPIQLIDKKIKEYGFNNFEYCVLAETNDIEELKKLEQYYILRLNTYVGNKCGYNLTLGGDGCVGFSMPEDKIHKGPNHYMFGKHWSESEKNKRRIGMIGKNKGRKLSQDAKNKISEKAKLRVRTLNPNYKHGRRINGKNDAVYTHSYYISHRNEIRDRAKSRYNENREIELKRAKEYRETHKKITINGKRRWVLK